MAISISPVNAQKVVVYAFNSDGTLSPATIGGGGGTGTVTSLSATSPVVATPTTITTTGAFSCPTCTTNAAGLTNGNLVQGNGGQATSDSGISTTTVVTSDSALTSNAVVLGNGSQRTKVVTGIVTNGSNSISLGGVGLGSGLINLLGTTSGTATIQGPAVAGTISNQIVFSNGILSNQIITATSGFVTNTTHSYAFTGASQVASSADGIITVVNAASSGFSRLTLGPTTSSFPALCPSGTTVLVGLANGNCTTLSPLTAAAITGSTLNTGANCSSSASPAVCAAAAGGSIAIPAGVNQTLQINTTAVTANSQIFLTIDEGLGTKLGVTCNTTLATLTQPVVTARSAGASFTIQLSGTTTANPVCVSYMVLN